MKLKFRAEKKDVIAFILMSFFVLIIIALCVSNVLSILHDGVPSGLNIFKEFNSSSVALVIVIWLAVIGTVFGSTSSYFFEREKGFGWTDIPKENGYSRWAKDKEIQTAKEVVRIPFADKQAKVGGTPIIYDKDSAYVDN